MRPRESLLPTVVRQRLLAFVRERLREHRSVVLAIDGAAGLGKTTLAKELQDGFPDLATVLHTDDYLTERHDRFNLGITAYDPRAIDLDTLRQDIDALTQGHDVTVRHYLHPTGTHGTPTVVTARPLVIIEGGHALNTTLHQRPPVGVFIDGTERAMHDLRCERDVRERGASRTSFDEWWPRMQRDYERHVQPNRKNADLIIHHTPAPRVLRNHLRQEHGDLWRSGGTLQWVGRNHLGLLHRPSDACT